MATLVKEKRKDKKKSKAKSTVKPPINDKELEESIAGKNDLIIEKCTDISEENTISNVLKAESFDTTSQVSLIEEHMKDSNISEEDTGQANKNVDVKTSIEEKKEVIDHSVSMLSVEDNFKDLNRKLAIMNLSNVSHLSDTTALLERKNISGSENLQSQAMPSAPVLDEEAYLHTQQQMATVQLIEKPKNKIKSIPIEVVLERCEQEGIRILSEAEEAVVEAGPTSGPEHPLVDLLSTFRSSLIAVDRERTHLTHGFSEEEKYRTALWKVEKRSVHITEPCPCGASIAIKASFEHAELLKEKLPVAKLKLEALLKDVQESYCHHQHEALLAYCQIEDLISETIKASKPDIREALSLIFQSLRLSDSAPNAFASALERWARALAEALADARDVRQLLFVIHHLFRQTLSVRWASRIVRLRVNDYISANQVIAILDVLLARPKPSLETALECTEESEEGWEEVDRHGSSGAVSDGTLRERDLLAIFYAFPLRDIITRLLHFTNADISEARPYEWVSRQHAHATLQSCCGVRLLLYTLRRAARVHAQYVRLHAAMRALARKALVALAALHQHSRSFYLTELEESVTSNLEAVFAEGLDLFGVEEFYSLPTTLLSTATALEYCHILINTLHDKLPVHIESLTLELPTIVCDIRVRIVSQAAIDRIDDHHLAETVLVFLFQCGIKRKTVSCGGKCELVAREWLPRLLKVHYYLYPCALNMMADLNVLEPVDPSALRIISVNNWRPNLGELRSVLDDWYQRCNPLLQFLLLGLNYSPLTGLSYESQLTIGSWICSWVRQSTSPNVEWPWQLLRRLRVHRIYWGPPIDAPHPDIEPVDLFTKAYAVCSSSWGHSIPLICSEGVSALCALAMTRPRDAAHCATPIMAVMAHSPESVSLTPKFAEFFTSLLSCRPSIMQRALGRGGDTGPDLLLRLILEQLKDDHWFEVERAALLRVWLHALWNPALPGPARSVLDTAAAACRHWPVLDAHVASLLQRENGKEFVSDAVSNALNAPLLCENILRGSHAQCARTHVYALLLRALDGQRVSAQKIHVDNAVKLVSGNISSEELVIYQSAKAALVAPLNHPSQLMLWRLFMHLYLERPPDNIQESTPPVGPLFYSGIIKTRTLGQIKKRLQETATYHHNEASTLKTEQQSLSVVKSTKPEKSIKASDDTLFPALSIIDLTGESSGRAAESDLSEDEKDPKDEETRILQDTSEKNKRDRYNLTCYHEGAEKMIREYLRWIDEGLKVRAMPHHADIARFISEQGLEASWQALINRSKPPPEAESPTIPTTVTFPSETPPLMPFHIAVNSILQIKDGSRRRPRRTQLKSSIEDVDIRDSRSLLASIDKQLQEIETFAKDWCSEMNKISTLDSKLWDLVGVLRVRRPLPTVKKRCPNNCKPISIRIPAEEWCISTGAERGIAENRNSARVVMRRLSRARPHVARSAASLQSLARFVGSKEAGVRVLERAWRAAGASHSALCPPTVSVLAAINEIVAQRWVCSDGRICADLLTRWGKHSASQIQQAHCSTLVVPRRLTPSDWPLVYTALLQTSLPDHLLFSCLSKFELKRWSETADSNSRRNLLEALLKAVQRWGPVPEETNHVLLELAGVHTGTLLDAREICPHVIRGSYASVECTIPPFYWKHIEDAVDRCAAEVSFEQLGHLLREVGVMWWKARTESKGKKLIIEYSAYAPYYARVLHSLLRAFVAAALKLSFTPERVGRYAWSALQESWSPWVSPHSAVPPLLPSTGDGEAYTPLLSDFIHTIVQIMVDCPGSEVSVLQQTWDWTIQSYMSVYESGSQESRVQMSALLVELSNLPWDKHQWCSGKCLQAALQISTVNDKELTSWCCRVWSKTRAETWIRGDNDRDTNESIAPRLASLLYLFTGTTLPHSRETYEEATRLPWYRLPGPALDEALERFFAAHHNPAQPYHDIPQFNVMMYASGLRIRPDAMVYISQMRDIQEKRLCTLSQWVRSACAPALAAHVTAHCNTLFEIITQLAPYIENSEGVIEALFSRAVVIMCIEPAASAALPVWTARISKASARLVRACISAASGLTAFEYFAKLADFAIRTFIDKEGSWEEVKSRFSECPWREAGALVIRTRLYAAYGINLAHVQDCERIRAMLHALSAVELQFNENDAIVAVWICTIGRACLYADVPICTSARAFLNAWATPPTRSLLRVVSLQSQPPAPTPRHRLLCRFALWILDPSESNAKDYEIACAAVPGSSRGDLVSTEMKQLPQLAMRLYPHQEKYFTEELKIASEEIHG